MSHKISGCRKTEQSEIWFSDVGNNKAKCDFCSILISTVGGSTGNLTRHLKTKHPFSLNKKLETSVDITENFNENAVTGSNVTELLPDLEEDATNSNLSTGNSKPITFDSQLVNSTRSAIKKRQTQTTIRSSDLVQINRPVGINRKKQLNKQLVKMIVKDYQPFRIVEDPEFRKLVSLLCPGYSLPTRKDILTNMIPQLMNETKAKVTIKLQEALAVCLSTDGWTSIDNESFIGITIHFIDKDTNLCSKLLDCIKFDERHTTENLSTLLKNTIQEWNLSNQISGAVTDNSPYITSAIRACGWRHISCFAHSLDLVVQAGLEHIKTVIKKVKSIVEYFKSSSQALTKLHRTQEQMNLPQVNLKQDVITRWNSTYDMICKIMQTKDAVITTLALINPELNTISTEEWDLLEISKLVLAIFKDITVEVSAENSVSLSKLMLFTSIINKHLNKYQDASKNEQFMNMIKTLKSEMSQRFGNIEDHELITQATFLDPRFKKYGFLHEHKFETTYNLLINELAALPLPKIPEINNENKDNNSSNDPHIVNECISIWADFDAKVEKHLAENNPTAAAIVEIDNYLQEPLLDRLEDPLVWWRERRTMYPKLYEFVLKRLCNIATSVPCERLFSKAGQILNDRRSRLSSSKVSQVLFLNSNLD